MPTQTSCKIIDRLELERLEMRIAAGLNRRPNLSVEEEEQLSPEARELYSRLPYREKIRRGSPRNVPTDVYRFFNAHGELLYVGLSCQIAARVGYHRSNQGWWHQVSRIEVEHFATRDEAALRERHVIATEFPRCNGNGGGA